MSAYRGFSRFDGQNAKGWLAAIAANKCRDFLKSPARRVALAEDVALEALAEADFSTECEVETMAEEQRVYALCNCLQKPCREVAVAYFCRQETITEIGERTGTNRKTVATRLYRAKTMIKTILLKEEGAYEV